VKCGAARRHERLQVELGRGREYGVAFSHKLRDYKCRNGSDGSTANLESDAGCRRNRSGSQHPRRGQQAMHESEEAKRKRFDELCQSIQKVWLVLLSYAFFCVVALLQPDEMTLETVGKIGVPFVGVSLGVNFLVFSFVGPAVLCGILFYLHILLEQWHSGEFDNYKERSTYIFNMKSKLARATSVFIFYALGSIVFTLFVFKVRAWPHVWGWGLFSCIMTGLLFLLLACRSHTSFARIGIAVCGVILLPFFVWISCPYNLANLFPLQLANANLSGQDLTSYSLRNVTASGANLKGADFSRQTLEKADFSYAHLEGADFTDAHLEGADFNHAYLEKADFSKANLRGAIFSRAVLTGADLTDADLEKADFTRADMQAVDLEHATLTGVKFRRTNLHNVINLDDRAQLAGVCGDSMTIETLSPPHTMDKCP
jgi:hypothetical protein